MPLMSPRPPLTPLSDALARLLAMLPPISPLRLPLAEAAGLVAAETILAEKPIPATPLAKRSGIAVAASELVGASPYAPVVLPDAPQRVRPGDALPAMADAVLPEDAVTASGPFHEIGQSAYPGEGAVLVGADLARGATILREGETVSPAIALALRLAGRDEIAVRRPTIALDEAEEAASAAAQWLREMLVGAGCRVVTSGPADLAILIRRDLDSIPVMGAERPLRGVAINPGSEIVLMGETGRPVLGLAPSFEALAAAFHALLLPALAACSGRRLRAVERPLLGKLVSQVGVAEIALLRDRLQGYEPLAVGQVTLAALLAADAVGVIAPESEGAAAGAFLTAIPLREPFEPL